MKTTAVVLMLAVGGWLPGFVSPEWVVRSLEAYHLPAGETDLYKCENGKVSFKSDAPLELIQAKSKKLRGLIDPEKQTFAWTVDVKSFEVQQPAATRTFQRELHGKQIIPQGQFHG
ncbi:MAG: hypothetical protein IPK76_22370 [Lewinellaceae bacterium]|nr:hypothetical protein [Lewinellaceae bacterium]